MADAPTCTAELFEHYARGGQQERSSFIRLGRPGNAASLALTQSQWMLLCRELGLMERGGPAGTSAAATPALLQDAFTAHALPGTASVPLPRMPYKEFVVALQAVAAQCGIADMWGLVAASPVLPSVQAAGGTVLRRASQPGTLPLSATANGSTTGVLPDDQAAALAALPTLLARVAALEAAVAASSQSSSSPFAPAPPNASVEHILSRLSGHDAQLASLAKTLEALQLEVRELRAKEREGGAAVSMTSSSGGPAAAVLEEDLVTGSPAPAAPRPPLPRLATVPAAPGSAGEDVGTLGERVRVMGSQQAALSTLTSGLAAEVKRVAAEVHDVKRAVESGAGKVARGGADSVTSWGSDGGDSEVGRTLEDMYRMRDSITLSHERARAEFSKRLEAVEALVERLTKAGIMPPPETATKAELARMQSELTARVNDLTARMEETLKQLEARFGSDLEEESNGPEKTNGSAASLDRSASAEEDGESQSKVKGPPPPRKRHTWDPLAKPSGGLLRPERSCPGNAGSQAAQDSGTDGDGLSAATQKLALERKHVQWSAECLARAEAVEVRRRMAEIKAKVQNGGMGSWDMGRVKNQLNKLSQRVAALERLQRMMDQMGAIGECLEILDRRQKEHKKRLESLETNLRERVVALEGSIVGLGEVDRRVGETREEVERLRRQTQGAVSTVVPVGMGQSPLMAMRLSNSFRGTTPAVPAPPGEHLSLDNPKVRLASRAQRTSFTGDAASPSVSSPSPFHPLPPPSATDGGYLLASPGLGAAVGGSPSGVLSSLVPAGIMAGYASVDGAGAGGSAPGSSGGSPAGPSAFVSRRTSHNGAVGGSEGGSRGSQSQPGGTNGTTGGAFGGPVHSRLGLAPFGSASGGLGGVREARESRESRDGGGGLGGGGGSMNVFEALAAARERPSPGNGNAGARGARGFSAAFSRSMELSRSTDREREKEKEREEGRGR